MMNTQTKKQVCMVVIICLALAAAMVPYYADRLPILPQLFNSTTNMVLLAVAVLCVTLVDLRMGVALTFLVLVLAVWVRTRSATELFQGYADELAATRAPARQHTAVLTSEEISDKEMSYVEASHPPRHPKVDEGAMEGAQEGFASHIGMDMINLSSENSASKFVSEQFANTANQHTEYSTQGPNCLLEGMPNVENAGHNELGKPLTASATYPVAHQMANLGTLFYPLHPNNTPHQ